MHNLTTTTAIGELKLRGGFLYVCSSPLLGSAYGINLDVGAVVQCIFHIGANLIPEIHFFSENTTNSSILQRAVIFDRTTSRVETPAKVPLIQGGSKKDEVIFLQIYRDSEDSVYIWIQ